MTKKDFWIMGIGLWLIALTTVVVINSFGEVKKLEECKQQRIRDFVPVDFVWQGILDSVQKGTYQPKCV